MEGQCDVLGDYFTYNIKYRYELDILYDFIYGSPFVFDQSP